MASETPRIFKFDFFTSSFVTGLQNLRQDNQLTDTVLKVQGQEFRCHKLVLAAQSKYFFSMFIADFKERQSDETRMPPEIDASAMATLLNYFYSGELALSKENIDSVFTATDYMRLDHLLDACIEYMTQNLDESNCIRWYVIADPIQYFSSGLKEFKSAASGMIVDKIAEISKTADFLGLSMKLISKILNSNNQLEKAQALYTMVLSWVGHDEDDRRKSLCELLEALPVDGVSHEFFASRIRHEELLRRDPKSVAWLLDNAMKRVTLLVTPESHLKSLLVVDRWSNECRKCVRIRLENPTPLAISDPPRFSGFSGVSHKGRIYLLCGYETEDSFTLDDPQGSWTQCASDLKFGRCESGCVVFGDDLFVVGGYDWKRGSSVKSCVKFNFGSGRKESLPEMGEERSLPGVAVYANSVYAACGSDALTTIERFDAREGRWCVVGRYATNIEDCSSATIGDCFYCCDWSSGAIERFNFRANRPETIRSLPKLYCWISSVDGDLFGACGERIFKYNAAADAWNEFCSGVTGVTCPIMLPWI